ncbi:MAG: hypothetical protein RLZZ563_1561, partial [Pseudomonadota bacterium]
MAEFGKPASKSAVGSAVIPLMHRSLEGHALKPLFSRHRSSLLRLASAVVVILLSLEFLSHAEQGFDGRAVLAFLAGLGWDQVLVSLLAVSVAFFAVSRQERAICRHLGLWPATGGERAAAGAAAAAAALSQTVGFGPVVGAIVRHRLRPDLTLKQSFAISAGITLGFFLGLGMLVLAGFVLFPGALDRHLAAALLTAALILTLGLALWPGRGRLGLAKPNLLTTTAFLFWLCIDLMALAAALWVLLPAGATPAFAPFAIAFLIALGIGLATGSPAGVGPFEAALITHLPDTDTNALMAGIIAFRMLAYALPALIGALWALVGPHLLRNAPQTIATPPHPATLPMAEAQLSRLGELALMPVGARSYWLGAALSQMRVAIGDPMGHAPTPKAIAAQITALTHLAHAESRLPCLYKTGPRTAATARRMGHAVLPIAQEAVLNPARFTLTGPDKARLRRKLSHARKAGLLVESPAHPPLADMAAVAQAWRGVHGTERGFSMGRWQPDYVRDQRIITARTPDGRMVAFVTFHCSATEWTLDLVRPAPDAPDGAIYAMICAALDLARDAGIPRLSLAAAPRPDYGLTGPLAPLARRLTRSSAGLAQFKSAFAPTWEPRYITAPNATLLLLGAAEISRAIAAPPPLALHDKADPEGSAYAGHALRDYWHDNGADFP